MQRRSLINGVDLFRKAENRRFIVKYMYKTDKNFFRVYSYSFVFLAVFSLFSTMLGAQEALKSAEEDYYDSLALQGNVERRTLNYRTFSDSAWVVDKSVSHPWQNQNLGTFRPLSDEFRMRIYGPELFVSANTAVPYGQNDGLLWQGRGFNTLLKGGVRLEGHGFELTLLPHFAFSQNADFDIMPSAYENQYGYIWDYGGGSGIDLPQRFGDKAFTDWGFGDSEVRWAWRNFTAGFGTQAIWLGPSHINPMLHSNNAPAYPRFDIGLRRQKISAFGRYLGDVEARLWVGRLSESDYFDGDNTNDNTMIHGIAFAYAPSFLPGFTLLVNRTCLVPWERENIKYIFPSKDNTIEDQKASVGFSWMLPQAGFELFGELGFDDFTPEAGALGYVRYPFHTMLYTAGFRKSVSVSPDRNVFGKLTFEWNSLEMSQDFQFQWPYSPYFHHQISQGYTNRGQLLGAGSGWGGNSQFLEFKLYSPKGSISTFIHRDNPDNNYIYREAIYAPASEELENKFFKSWKANLVMGINSDYFLKNNFIIGGGFAYNFIVNPHYYLNKTDYWANDYKHNFSFQFNIKYRI